MSAWWSKVGDVVKRHDGPRPKVQAYQRIIAHTGMAGISLDACGLYRRDPTKHPEEPNVLPEVVERARHGR